MKRIAFLSGMALWLLAAGCAQHDTKSPDTSGVDPQNPNLTTDTATDTTRTTTSPNMNSDGTNNNQGVNTADSLKKQ